MTIEDPRDGSQEPGRQTVYARWMASQLAHPGRARMVLAGLALPVVAAIVVTLHALAIVPLGFETFPVTGIQHLEGPTYTAAMPPDPYVVPALRAERVFENGVESPFPPLARYDAVTRSGAGRFSLSSSTLYFSATDSSDPRTNGRQYTVTRPTSLSPGLIVGLWVAALLSIAAAVALHREAVEAWLAAPPFAAAAALLLFVVAANRLWFFVDYPIAAIHPDSAGYYSLTDQIGKGEWPRFGVRPPVYPMVMTAVFAVADRVMVLTALQTILSTLAALTVVYAMYRWRRWLGIPAAVAMAGYLFSTAAMEHDTGMLSESLYSTLLVFSFGSLILALRGVRPAAWLPASSAAMALAILTRPAGMFLMVTYAIVLAFMAWNRYGRRAIAAFALPFPALLLVVCVYNWRTIDVFAVTAWGEANLAVGTFTFWAQDPDYPADINDGIGRIRAFVGQRLADSGVNAAVLDTTWDPVELSRVFIHGFHGTPLGTAMTMGGGAYETTGRAWIRRISFDSIRKRPDIYAKFVYSMLYNYFRPWQEDDFRLYVINRVQAAFVERRFAASRGNTLVTAAAKEFADASPPPTVVITEPDPSVSMELYERVLLRATPGWRVYELTYRFRKWAFTRWLWPACALLTLLASLAVLVRTRGRHPAAFAAFIVTISLVGASLVISLVEYSQPRYSYPMEWTYFIGPLFLPLFLSRGVVGVRETEPAQV